MDPLIYMCTRDYDMVLSYINTHVDILTVHLAILSVYTVRMMSFHKNLILNIGCRSHHKSVLCNQMVSGIRTLWSF